MNILAIETSCDETAVSIVSFESSDKKTSYTILSNLVFSQIDIHREYGGVFPMMAKRAHAQNLPKLIEQALRESNFFHTENTILDKEKVTDILEREPECAEQLIEMLSKIKKPAIDALAVTVGPGLEPALWVGINVAKVLSFIWDIPIIPTNHMEGHIVSSLITSTNIGEKSLVKEINFPGLTLLISGGHTELVLVKNIGAYEKIGETRDDAVGEAFDKVARLIDLPYPGGPEIERLAQSHQPLLLPLEKKTEKEDTPTFPRPMMNTNDYDFSFSGLKTAARYWIRDFEQTLDKTSEISLAQKSIIAKEFQDAVTDVLLKKTFRAINEYGIKTLIIAGGVSANTFIRESFTKKASTEYTHLKTIFPYKKLATDNALMIAFAGYFQFLKQEKTPNDMIVAQGNMSL